MRSDKDDAFLYTGMHNVHVGIVGLLYSDANSREIDDRLSLIATFYTYTKHRINGLLSPFRIMQDNLHNGQNVHSNLHSMGFGIGTQRMLMHTETARLRTAVHVYNAWELGRILVGGL